MVEGKSGAVKYSSSGFYHGLGVNVTIIGQALTHCAPRVEHFIILYCTMLARPCTISDEFVLLGYTECSDLVLPEVE